MMETAIRKCEQCRQNHLVCTSKSTTPATDSTGEPKCDGCIKSNKICGPKLTCYESELTERGRKRKKNLQNAVESGRRKRHSLDTSDGGPIVSTDHVQNVPEVLANPVTSTLRGDLEISTGSSTSHCMPAKYGKKFGEIYKLLSILQYFKYTGESTSLLEQGMDKSKGSLVRAKESPTIQDNILERLTKIVEGADIGACWAEGAILRAFEVLGHLERLSGDKGPVLNLELTALDKLLSLLDPADISKRNESKTSSGNYWDRERLKFLQIEQNRLRDRCYAMKSPVISKASSQAGSNDTTSAKNAMRQSGGLSFSTDSARRAENTDERAMSRSMSRIISRITSNAPQMRSGLGDIDEYFPSQFNAFLTGTDDEARSHITQIRSSVQVSDYFGKTIAHVAARSNRVGMLQDLIYENKKDFDRRDDDNLNPLMITVVHGHSESFKLLFEAGYSWDGERDSSNRNVLSIAARHGHRDIVEYLVNKHHPVDDVERLCSPLHDSIESEHPEIPYFLLQNGADPSVEFKNVFAQDLAAKKGLNHLANWIRNHVQNLILSSEPANIPPASLESRSSHLFITPLHGFQPVMNTPGSGSSIDPNAQMVPTYPDHRLHDNYPTQPVDRNYLPTTPFNHPPAGLWDIPHTSTHPQSTAPEHQRFPGPPST